MAPKRKATPSPSAPTPTPPSPSPPPAAAPTPTASGKKKKTSRAQQEPAAPLRRSPRFDSGSSGASPSVAASPSASVPKGSSGAQVEKKSTKASLKKVEEEVADEASKSGEDAQSDASTAEKVMKTVVIEHCKQCKSFKNRATEVKEGLEEALPDIKVVLNPDKPRKGCFEVRVEGEDPFISLLEMKRPFSQMKALDMKVVIADIVKRME